jgi:hypothetical protein
MKVAAHARRTLFTHFLAVGLGCGASNLLLTRRRRRPPD